MNKRHIIILAISTFIFSLYIIYFSIDKVNDFRIFSFSLNGSGLKYTSGIIYFIILFQYIYFVGVAACEYFSDFDYSYSQFIKYRVINDKRLIYISFKKTIEITIKSACLIVLISLIICLIYKLRVSIIDYIYFFNIFVVIFSINLSQFLNRWTIKIESVSYLVFLSVMCVLFSYIDKIEYILILVVIQLIIFIIKELKNDYT